MKLGKLKLAQDKKMTNKEIKNAIQYWKKTAEHDCEIMEFLFKGKKYSDSLFFGHIVLEKIIKGLFVQNLGEQALFTHDLVRLAKMAQLDLNNQDINFLSDVNDFNIRARYPEHKLAFYKKCTPKYTTSNIELIRALYKKLCHKLK